MTQVWRLVFVVCDSLGILKSKHLRDVPNRCQPADSLIVFERSVFEAGETPWFTASFLGKCRHIPGTSLCSLMHICIGKVCRLLRQSGRIRLEIPLCLIQTDFLYQGGQSTFGCLYLYQQLFPLGALIWHKFPLSDGPELKNVVQIEYICTLFFFHLLY